MATLTRWAEHTNAHTHTYGLALEMSHGQCGGKMLRAWLVFKPEMNPFCTGWAVLTFQMDSALTVSFCFSFLFLFNLSDRIKFRVSWDAQWGVFWFQVSVPLLGLALVLLSFPEHASLNREFDNTSGRISGWLLTVETGYWGTFLTGSPLQ